MLEVMDLTESRGARASLLSVKQIFNESMNVVGETLDPAHRGNKTLKKKDSRAHSHRFGSTLHL